MHLSDILDALQRNTVSEIEDGFRALVNWPGEDRIDGSSPATRCKALRSCCEALADDSRIMPGGIVDVLATDFEGLADRSYAAGARLVLDNWSTFSARLARQE